MSNQPQPLSKIEREELEQYREDYRNMLAFANDPTWAPLETERYLSNYILNRLRDFGYRPGEDRKAYMYKSLESLRALGERVLYIEALTSNSSAEKLGEAVREECRFYHAVRAQDERERYPNNPANPPASDGAP